MGKAEKGTPKDIANKIKAKGLQKLKFYCQMCEKQCRDANGFKCHMTSETHLRNMKLFSQNATGMMDSMSKEFETNYLDTLRRRHGTKRVNANNIYQEVIQDRQHIHMNATKWATLSDFCQYLGRTGKCIVDETERGWYIQYIERDASILARQEAQKKRVEAERTAEERFAKQMEIQRVEAAKMLDRAGGSLMMEATKLERGDVNQSVSLSLGKKKAPAGNIPASAQLKTVFGDAEDEESDEESNLNESKPGIDPALLEKSKRLVEKQSKLSTSKDVERKKRKADSKESAPHEKKRRQEDDNRKDYWLRRDIICRIISKKLANGKYFKRKAVIERVLEDKFTAEVEVLDSRPDERDGGDILRLDQDDLETVIPKEGKKVRILNGKGRGKKARVLKLFKERCKAELELEDGTILDLVDYEDFSKMA